VTLRIGQVAGGGAFEPAEVLSQLLMAKFGEKVADGVKRSRPFLRQIDVQKGHALIVLVAEGDRPEDAASLLKTVVDGVEKSHAEHFARTFGPLVERLQRLDSQRGALERQFQDATALLETLRQRDPVQASLILFERGRVAKAILDLDAEKPGLMQRLEPPQSQRTTLLGEVVTPTEPATHRAALVLVLFGMFGVLVGVGLAFLAESVAKARVNGA